MTTFGLTATGFVKKTFAELQTEIQEAFRTAFGASIRTDPASRNGQLIDIMSDRLKELWDLAEGVNAAQDPDAATGAQLDAVAALTGTLRARASSSTVIVTCTGQVDTALLAGRVVSVVGTGVRFALVANATIATPGNWFALTAYLLGARVTNGGNVYEVITPGTSAASGGPLTTSSNIADGSVHWKFLGAGTGVVDAAFASEETGPQIAVAGSLTTIETAVAGWNNAVNELDATPGTNEEANGSLRIRREAEIRATGKSPLESIRANLLRVTGVTSCSVFENTTDLTDADGVLPHAVEIMLQGGVDADIVEAIFKTVAGGIATCGTTSSSYTDSQGFAHVIKYSRPIERDIWVIVNVIKDPNFYPTNGDALIKQAIVDYGDLYPTGRDVVASALAAQPFRAGILGLLDVSSVLIGLANPPTVATTIVNTPRQLAFFDTSRISVVAANGTP